MMNQEEKDSLLSLYEDRLEKYGHSYKTVGWGSRESQELRFNILFRNVDIENKSILDLGCGLGDVIDYLNNAGVSNYQYIGVDISDKLIDQAKRRHKGENIKFIVKNIIDDELPKADVVIASGMLTFNIEYNRVNIESIMKKIFQSSRELCAINFLSSYVDFELEKNLHFSPEKIFSYAKNISNFVSIYHDYPLYEFTVQLRR